MRLYHGWHKGLEPTENLRAITAAASQVEFFAANTNVHISPRIEYGHTLLSALEERIHRGIGIHLPNTLREQSSKEQLREKMVDTALAADLLHWARNGPGDWALILANDDDFIPPVFTAESWTRPSGGRVLIVRILSPRKSRDDAARFGQGGRLLQLQGLMEVMNH